VGTQTFRALARGSSLRPRLRHTVGPGESFFSISARYRVSPWLLARENGLTFVPFLLEGVAGELDLNQSDGIHPTSAGAARIADHLWPDVKTMIAK
jgi:hypothetical protein